MRFRRAVRVKRFKLTAGPKLRENDIEAACLDLLRLRGYYVTRQQSGLFKTPDGRWVRIGTPGVPDYTALHRVYPGFLMECKRPGGGGLSPEQVRKIFEIQAGYRLAVVVIDDVEELHRWVIEHEGKAERLWKETK